MNSDRAGQSQAEGYGQLHIVATPIGNMDDISLRALKTLKSVDYIAAEDTRHTGGLLKHHQIDGRLISCHEHNEKKRAPGLIEKLLSGQSIALVSDAGSPVVSDPGSYLIKAAIENGITVVPIPGASAAIAALSASGLPSDSFLFAGFCPRKSSKREKRLTDLSRYPETLIFYESPRRILPLMEQIIEIMGDREAVLSREMTKMHEEFIRGPLSRIVENLKERVSIKGECALIVEGRGEDDEAVSMESIQEELKAAMTNSDVKISQLAREIATRLSISKKMVYQEALKIKNSQDLLKNEPEQI